MDDRMLRSQLRRGPWAAGGDLNNVFRQLDSVNTEPMSIAQDIGMPPWQSSRVQTGLENHNFRDDPPDRTANLADITNKLPGWSFTQSSGTAITAKWVADTSSGSGGVIRFTVAAGAAGDFSYLEQIVSVASTRAQTWAALFAAQFVNRSGSNALAIWGEVQALKSDGTTTGTPTAFTTLWSSTWSQEQISVPASTAILPSDAQFLRVRVGVKRDAALTSVTGTIDLSETRILMEQPYGLFPEINTTKKPGLIAQKGGSLYIHPVFTPTSVYSPGGTNYPYIRLDESSAAKNWPKVINAVGLEGAVGTYGWVHRAYPQGISAHTVTTSTNTLTAQYDCLLIPIIVTSLMRVGSYTIRQGISDGTTRSFECRLWAQVDLDTTSTLSLVSGSDASSGSYTASAVSNETVTPSNGAVDLEPGIYWMSVQNTHATRTHVTRTLTGGDWTPNVAATSTTIGNLSGQSTLDTTKFATRITGTPMVRLNGRVFGEGSTFG